MPCTKRMPTVPLKGQAAQAPGRTPARQTNQTVSARHHPEVGGYTTGVRSGGASSSNYHSGEATLPRMYSEERLCDQAYPRFSVFKSISPPLIVPPTNVVAVAWVFPHFCPPVCSESRSPPARPYAYSTLSCPGLQDGKVVSSRKLWGCQHVVKGVMLR